MLTLKICFFASLSEALNTREETLQLPAGSTLNDLKDLLLARGPHWQALNNETILCAINQQMQNHPNPVLDNHCEIAFFPPVTGG